MSSECGIEELGQSMLTVNISDRAHKTPRRNSACENSLDVEDSVSKDGLTGCTITEMDAPVRSSTQLHFPKKLNTAKEVDGKCTRSNPLHKTGLQSITTALLSQNGLRKYFIPLFLISREELEELSELLRDTPISNYSRSFLDPQLEHHYILYHNEKNHKHFIALSFISVIAICIITVSGVLASGGWYRKALPYVIAAICIMLVGILCVWLAPKFSQNIRAYTHLICVIFLTIASIVFVIGWDGAYYSYYRGPNGVFLTYISTGL
jgi:hypothetical protein